MAHVSDLTFVCIFKTACKSSKFKAPLLHYPCLGENWLIEKNTVTNYCRQPILKQKKMHSYYDNSQRCHNDIGRHHAGPWTEVLTYDAWVLYCRHCHDNDGYHSDNNGCHGDSDCCHGDLHNSLEVTAKEFRLVTLNFPVLYCAVIKESVELNCLICCAAILVLGYEWGQGHNITYSKLVDKAEYDLESSRTVPFITAVIT